MTFRLFSKKYIINVYNFLFFYITKHFIYKKNLKNNCLLL